MPLRETKQRREEIFHQATGKKKVAQDAETLEGEKVIGGSKCDNLKKKPAR